MTDDVKKTDKNTDNKKAFRLQHWQQISLYLVAYDIVAVTLAYFLALLIRFDFKFSVIPFTYLQAWEYFAPIYAVICIAVFWRGRLYRSIWRFASFKELERITLATIVTTIAHIIGITIIIRTVFSDPAYGITRMPYSYHIIGAMLQFILITAVRFSYRYVLLLRANRSEDTYSKVMIVGVHSIIGTT